jgi:homoserine kinase
MSFRVTAPASSANLGPGFDSMALALQRYMTVTVTPGDAESSNAQQNELSDGRDMVRFAMQYLADAIDSPLPPAGVYSESQIPVARGMGSSAAAIIAGMIAGNRLFGDPLSSEELLQLAAKIEGHSDNLAAALYGGAVLATPVDSGWITVGLSIGLELQAVLLVPKRIGFTTDARAVVPEHVDRADAVFNASRCALLVHALASGEATLLAEAMKDRWHQPYRAALYSYLDDVIAAALEAGACGASLSGSGPTVLALAEPSATESVVAGMRRAAELHDLECSTEVLLIDTTGAIVVDCGENEIAHGNRTR